MSKRSLILLGGLPIFLFAVLQFIPPVWLWETNPTVLSEPQWDSPQTRELAARACFDCHSDETHWPLYTRVAPISWLILRDVVGGRRQMNFSEWGSTQTSRNPQRRAREAAEQINSGKMPPDIYLMMHPEARLTDQEKQQLIQGLQNSLR